MKHVALLFALFTIPACATIQPYATCDNARVAAAVAQRAMDRFCPMAPAR